MVITFQCACGQNMQAREENAGLRVQCPACSAIVTVPVDLMPARAGTERLSAPGHLRAGGPPLPSAPTLPADSDRYAPRPKPAQASSADGPRRGMAVWMKLLVLTLILLVLGGGAWLVIALTSGGDTPNETAREQLAVVPRDAAGFMTLRVDDLWKSAILDDVRAKSGDKLDKALRDEFGLALGDIDRLTLVLPSLPDPRRGDVDFWGVIHTKAAYDKDKILKKLVPDARESKVGAGKIVFVGGPDDLAVHFADKEIWFGTNMGITLALDTTRKTATGPLTAPLALAASDRVHGALAGHIPEGWRARLRDDLGFWPPELKPLSQLTSFTFTFSVSTGAIEAQLQFPTAAAARDAVAAVKLGVSEIERDLVREAGFGGDPFELMIFQAGAKLFRDVTVEARDRDVIVKAPGAAAALTHIVSTIADKADSFRFLAAKATAANNMRQLLIAMHAYHDVYKRLPPAKLNKGLSWRVAILPYIEQEPLYRKFNLDEPWDSPHNKPLLDEMPALFRPVGAGAFKPGHTCYQVFTGKELIFHRDIDKKRMLTHIADGTSNTFLIVESSKLVPWTAPDDIEYEPFAERGPAPDLGYQIPDEFLVGMADAVVVWFPRKTPRRDLDLFIHPSDGRPVPALPMIDRPFRFFDFGAVERPVPAPIDMPLPIKEVPKDDRK